MYYGEDEWDGARSLIDMLDIPEEFESLISDCKFNLIELRKSESLKFQNEDVRTILKIERIDKLFSICYIHLKQSKRE